MPAYNQFADVTDQRLADAWQTAFGGGGNPKFETPDAYLDQSNWGTGPYAKRDMLDFVGRQLLAALGKNLSSGDQIQAFGQSVLDGRNVARAQKLASGSADIRDSFADATPYLGSYLRTGKWGQSLSFADMARQIAANDAAAQAAGATDKNGPGYSYSTAANQFSTRQALEDMAGREYFGEGRNLVLDALGQAWQAKDLTNPGLDAYGNLGANAFSNPWVTGGVANWRAMGGTGAGGTGAGGTGAGGTGAGGTGAGGTGAGGTGAGGTGAGGTGAGGTGAGGTGAGGTGAGGTGAGGTGAGGSGVVELGDDGLGPITVQPGGYAGHGPVTGMRPPVGYDIGTPPVPPTAPPFSVGWDGGQTTPTYAPTPPATAEPDMRDPGAWWQWFTGLTPAQQADWQARNPGMNVQIPGML